MSGYLQRITAGGALPGITASISDDAIDAVARNMPGLSLYLDPAKLAARSGGGVEGYERASGKRVFATASSLSLSNSVAGHGGQYVVGMSALDNNMRIIAPPPNPTLGFTIIMVVSFHADLLTNGNTVYLLNSWQNNAGSNLYQQRFTLTTGGLLSLNAQPNVGGSAFNSSSNITTLGVTTSPSALPVVIGASFNNAPAAGSKSGELWLNRADTNIGSASNLQGGPLPNPSDPLSSLYLGYANAVANSGLKGTMGRMFYFDRPYHTDSGLRAQANSLIAALKTLYAIAAP